MRPSAGNRTKSRWTSGIFLAIPHKPQDLLNIVWHSRCTSVAGLAWRSSLYSISCTQNRPLAISIRQTPTERTSRVSWDWLTYAPVSTTSAEYFGVSISTINWLSTLFLFAFVVATPAVMYTLNRGGPKPSIVAASGLILVGNWVRYAGARAREDGNTGGIFGIVLFGQILIGFAQPFVLAAPTRYSDLWFTERGRISATAVASLANPLGGALGQLIDPFWATRAAQIPSMTLWVAIVVRLVQETMVGSN